MINSKTYKEWEELCEKHSLARDTHYKSLAEITSKFSAIAQGTSQENPSLQELSTFDKTGKDWEDVKNEMKDFIKKHT